MMHKLTPPRRSTGGANGFFLGFLAIAGYFLLTEHRAHVVPYLPFLLLLACPLMHIFMHHGHGGHGAGGEHEHAQHRGHGGCCGGGDEEREDARKADAGEYEHGKEPEQNPSRPQRPA
ncbi:MAG: DUF2933 domain-containing protein [Gammaproteobacteria bacterium]|nr:DUF2933 domain-containing protein [Gammaproteobacteria bacterium]